MIALDGEVACGRGSGVVNLWLRGRMRSEARVDDVDVYFAGASVAALPALLHDVRIIELEPGASQTSRYRIESPEMRVELECRSMQLHRRAGEQLFSAVPAVAVPWQMRAGWTLLLSVLRLPGVGALVLGRRGAA
jgi:hypothetical protein